MAKNITIAGASYTGVPAVNLQQTGGGTARFVDTSGDTVIAETLLSGYTAHGADGEPITGTLKPVLYTPQTLTEDQKAQARENIGAAEGSGTITTDEAYIHENLLEVEKTLTFQNDGEWGDTEYIYTGEDWTPRGGFRFESPLNGVTFTQKDDVTIRLDGTASAYTNQNLSGPSGHWHPLDTSLGGKTLQIVTCSKRIYGEVIGFYCELRDASYAALGSRSNYIAYNAKSTITNIDVPAGTAFLNIQLTIIEGTIFDNDDIQIHVVEQEKLQSVSLSETDEYSGVTATELLTFPYKSIVETKLEPAYVRYDSQTLTPEQQKQARENIGADSFDCETWGLPILRLTGSTEGMSKENAVTLNYEYGERSGTCSVKWQGGSSIALGEKVGGKYNFTIKFDNAFEAYEGWGEQKKYCTKANVIDHSHARNLVNAKLWGQMVKSRSNVPANLSGLVNGGAVDGFPCIITLNGEFHGLYTFNIPKDAWMFGMGSGTQEAIICADKHVDATRFKAPALVDESDFELEYVTDENNAGWVVTSVNQLINACINSDGTDLDTTIAQYLDWQSAIDYYIFTVMMSGHDMSDKNYILATFDGVKWFFSAYDMDSTYGLLYDGTEWLTADWGPNFESYASLHRVMELIKTYKKDALKARYNTLRNTVLSESNVATVLNNFTGKIPDPVYMQDAKKWPLLPNTSTSNAAQIRDYYRMRVAYADKWMEQL